MHQQDFIEKASRDLIIHNFAIKNSVVVSRAFKSIQEILDFISNDKNVNKVVLLKGKTWQEEIKTAKSNILNNWNYSVKQSILGVNQQDFIEKVSRDLIIHLNR